MNLAQPAVPSRPLAIPYAILDEARHPAGGEVPAQGSGQRHRQRREHDSKLPESMGRPKMNGTPHLRARARGGRCDYLTIFLLQECPLRGTHLDNCAECKNLRGRQDNDTYADLAKRKCTPPTRHPPEEGFANRRAHSTKQFSHAIAYRPAVRTVPRALGVCLTNTKRGQIDSRESRISVLECVQGLL